MLTSGICSYQVELDETPSCYRSSNLTDQQTTIETYSIELEMPPSGLAILIGAGPNTVGLHLTLNA